MQKFWIGFGIMIIILMGLVAVMTVVCDDDWCYIFPWQKQAQNVTSFEDCATVTGKVLESYPRQCIYKGKTYVERLAAPPPPVSPAPVQNVSVAPNSIITSPLSVTGEILGTWFFEASFPIRVLDANDAVLGTGIAQAQGNWMQTGFVPFTAGVTFSPSPTQTGFLVFEKDNPSGLPQNSAEYRIPVNFW